MDVQECKGIRKVTGLMFKSSSTDALLFHFKRKTNMKIHSLFCPKFVAVWLDNGKIVDIKLVKPWRLSVSSEKHFTDLIEIPVSKRYRRKIELLLKS